MSLIQKRNNEDHTLFIIECIEIMIISAYFLQNSYTLIHLASRDGHIQVVEKLISSGTDVNVVNKVSVNY